LSVLTAKSGRYHRAALNRHWQQRLERAGYQVERARRQYGVVEPLCDLEKNVAQNVFPLKSLR
jgi:hypothetical protein